MKADTHPAKQRIIRKQSLCRHFYPLFESLVLQWIFVFYLSCGICHPNMMRTSCHVHRFADIAIIYSVNFVAGEKEIVGTLTGFDDYVNMVLEDVVEYENTVDGKRVTKLDTILLNGNHITMLVPGGEGPEV